MSLAKGAAAPVTFKTTGGEGLTQEEIRTALSENKFKPVDKEKARYLAVGWINPHKAHSNITDAIPAHDGLVLCFRIDAVKVAAKDVKFELNKLIDEYLRETGRAKVTKHEKMEMREQVLEDLRYVTPPTRTFVHVYWDWNRNRLFVQPCSAFVEACLTDLVQNTFGMHIAAEHYHTDLRRALGDEEGDGVKSSFSLTNFTHRFLSWLQWRIRDEGVIIVGKRRVNMYFTDDVTVQNMYAQHETVRVMGDNVMDSAVMSAAMATQHIPVSAKCEISFDDNALMTTMTWDPLKWRIKGLKPPTYRDKGSFERIQIRTELFSDLYDLRTNLLKWFVEDKAHTEEGWEKIWQDLLEE